MRARTETLLNQIRVSGLSSQNTAVNHPHRGVFSTTKTVDGRAAREKVLHHLLSHCAWRNTDTLRSDAVIGGKNQNGRLMNRQLSYRLILVLALDEC
ncbi:Uncharacterised protein [Vibrio cholerae]|nr:Uncharacterised protein [Vibrio cholerae]CSB77939.1 Uncharacterised protein [Vibrio cholerae]CSD29139.1 Uncharacterised protein [Vibrio cholerae]